MTHKEFCDLTGFCPKETYYHDVIEPEYLNSPLDKFAFCKQWVKKGGIMNAYHDLLDELHSSRNEIRNLQHEIASLNNLLKLEKLKTIVNKQ